MWITDGGGGRGLQAWRPQTLPPPPPPPVATDRGGQVRDTGRDGARPTIGDGTGTPGPVPSPGGGFPTPPPAPASGDGSGPHGASGVGIGDRLFEQVAYRLADAADAIGLNNAARHLRHFLGNSGEALSVDPAAMRRDMPAIAAEMDRTFNTQVRDAAAQRVADGYVGEPMQFQITTPWNTAYAKKALSQDWFYAVGGFSYAHTATVTVTPNADGSARVAIDSQLHVFDRYNWDGGKSVTIGPVTVNDEQLGKLHQVGLAQEYDVRGTTSGPSATFDVPRR